MIGLASAYELWIGEIWRLIWRVVLLCKFALYAFTQTLYYKLACLVHADAYMVDAWDGYVGLYIINLGKPHCYVRKIKSWNYIIVS